MKDKDRIKRLFERGYTRDEKPQEETIRTSIVLPLKPYREFRAALLREGVGMSEFWQAVFRVILEDQALRERLLEEAKRGR